MRYAQLIVLTVLAVMPATAQTITSLSDFVDIIESPALPPDGKTLAFEWEKPDLSWAIYTRPFGGGQPTRFAGGDPDTGLPTDARWSPDGKQIAYLRVAVIALS